jgi:hypothetical protein
MLTGRASSARAVSRPFAPDLRLVVEDAMVVASFRCVRRAGGSAVHAGEH